jgi:PRC-barrel domain
MSSQDFPPDPMDEQPTAAETGHQGSSLRGHVMIDDRQQKLGTVTDVLYDETGDARWAVVDPGMMRSEHFVPVEGSYVADDGTVVVPYGKDQVKTAAKAPRDHVLPAEVERELEEHYEVGHGRSGPSDFDAPPTS